MDEIVEAIFPGRNKGLTTHGQYFPLDGLSEGAVEPAYSPVLNMTPNYVGSNGEPSAISFADETLLNNRGMVSLASKKSPPIATTQGVFSKREPSPVVGPGQNTANADTANADTANKDTANTDTANTDTANADTTNADNVDNASTGGSNNVLNII